MYVLLLVFFAFLGLKLSGAVDWSWWAVASPALLYGFLFLVVVAITTVALVTAHKVSRSLGGYSRSARIKGIV